MFFGKYFYMLDVKDAKILRVLEQDAKLTNEEISRKTGMPTTTVHNRIKRLEKSGIIRGYVALVDKKKLGREISAYILITVDYKLLKQRGLSQHDLARTLRKYDFVEDVNMVTGQSDLILKISVDNVGKLDDFITKDLRNIDGVERTQTLMVLSSF